MQIFLLDLWHDLREKRLWPVAVALLLGLVAVPVLLAKPAEEPSAPAVTTAVPEEKQEEALAALAEVKLGQDVVGSGSTLGVFDPDNPFQPPKGAIKKEDATPPASSGPGTASSTTDGGSIGGGPTGGGDVSTGGGGGTTGGGDTGGGGDDPVDGETRTTVFKYVVDVTFSANGRTRRIKGLEKLDMLPSSRSPLLIFMGVTAKGDDAVFLVDSTLEAAGEGRCKPSPQECSFAFIGAGAEYVFTEEDGDTYTIKIDEIRRVKVDTSKGAQGAKARASVGPQRRFIPPVFADEVEVAEDDLEDSSSDTDSR